jgi:hypothetical protein
MSDPRLIVRNARLYAKKDAEFCAAHGFAKVPIFGADGRTLVGYAMYNLFGPQGTDPVRFYGPKRPPMSAIGSDLLVGTYGRACKRDRRNTVRFMRTCRLEGI